jgi:hypothetical protein
MLGLIGEVFFLFVNFFVFLDLPLLPWNELSVSLKSESDERW